LRIRRESAGSSVQRDRTTVRRTAVATPHGDLTFRRPVPYGPGQSVLGDLDLPESIRMSLGPLLVEPFVLDTTVPPPGDDDQRHRNARKADESKPALRPVHIGDDGLDLVREEVG